MRSGLGVLFLDDCPARRLRFLEACPLGTTVETADEAIEALKLGGWDVVFLDHDLGGEVYCDSSRADTGSEVVRWIVANRPRVRRCVVHTMNDAAGFGMVEALRDAGYRASRQSFLHIHDKLAKVLAEAGIAA